MAVLWLFNIPKPLTPCKKLILRRNFVKWQRFFEFIERMPGNSVYASETTFWRDVVDKSSHNQRAWNNLGMAEALACRYDSAIRAFEEAIRLTPGYPQPQVNLELLKNGELSGLPEQCGDTGDPP